LVTVDINVAVGVEGLPFAWSGLSLRVENDGFEFEVVGFVVGKRVASGEQASLGLCELTVLLGASVEQDVAGIFTVTGNTQALTEASNSRKRLDTNGFVDE
jgi:hypothetical protein